MKVALEDVGNSGSDPRRVFAQGDDFNFQNVGLIGICLKDFAFVEFLGKWSCVPAGMCASRLVLGPPHLCSWAATLSLLFRFVSSPVGNFVGIWLLGININIRLISASALSPALLAHSVWAAAPHVLDIDNRVPQFEIFYAHETKQPLTPEARFALWQKEDGLAAVPPGPEGDKMARKLLDAAWDRYPALIPKLPALTNAAKSEAESAFAAVNELLGTREMPIHSRLILYVGQFDNNAFTIPPMEGKPATVLMPVENVMLQVALAHELTHSVHLQVVRVKNSFGAPVGETMFIEGLAMRSSQRLVAGLPETAYTQMPGDKDWLAQCYANKSAILKAIVPDLEKSGSEIAMKYTFGQGNTGMQREVYCAGWIATGTLLESGKSLREIALIPENRMVAAMHDVLANFR